MNRELFQFIKFKLFFNQKKFNHYLLQKGFLNKQISQQECLELIKFYHKKSIHFFNNDTYLILLQASLLYKNSLVAEFILNSKFEYNGKGISFEQTKSFLVNQAFCRGIYYESHPAWLFLMSTHTVWQILGLDDKEDNENFYHFSKNILSHPKIKPFLTSPIISELILENSHEKSKPLVNAILLDIGLVSKNLRNVKKPLKI